MQTLSSLLISTADSAHERLILSQHDWSQTLVVIDRHTLSQYAHFLKVPLERCFSHDLQTVFLHTSLDAFSDTDRPVGHLQAPRYQDVLEILTRFSPNLVVFVHTGLDFWPPTLPCPVLSIVPWPSCLDFMQRAETHALPLITSKRLRVAIW